MQIRSLLHPFHQRFASTSVGSAVIGYLRIDVTMSTVLVQPLKSLGGTRSVWRKVLVSWLLALVFAVPQLFIFVQTEETSTHVIFHPAADDRVATDGKRPTITVTRTTLECKSVGYTEEWWQRKVYFAFMTIYILVIPTAIMTFCYSRIIKAVWLRAAKSGGGPMSSGSGGGARQLVDIDAPRIHFVTARKYQEPPHHGRQNPNADRTTGASVPARIAVSSKRKVVKMTMTVIVGFVVCWTPYFVVSLIRIYSDYSIRLDTLLSVSELMALGHSALNPLLYIVYSTRTVRASCQSMKERRANRRHHHYHRRRQAEDDIVGLSSSTSMSSCCCCCCSWLCCCRPGDDQTSHPGAHGRAKSRDCRLTSKKPRHPGIVTPPSTSSLDPPVADGNVRGGLDADQRACCCDDGCGIQRILCGHGETPNAIVTATTKKKNKTEIGDLIDPRRRMADRHQLPQQQKRGSRVLFVSSGHRQQQQLGANTSPTVVQQPTTSSSSATVNRRAIWTSSSGPCDNSFRRNTATTTTTTASSTATGRPRRATYISSTSAPTPLPTSSRTPLGVGANINAAVDTELNVLRRGDRESDPSRAAAGGPSWSTRDFRSMS